MRFIIFSFAFAAAITTHSAQATRRNVGSGSHNILLANHPEVRDIGVSQAKVTKLSGASKDADKGFESEATKPHTLSKARSLQNPKILEQGAKQMKSEDSKDESKENKKSTPQKVKDMMDAVRERALKNGLDKIAKARSSQKSKLSAKAVKQISPLKKHKSLHKSRQSEHAAFPRPRSTWENARASQESNERAFKEGQLEMKLEVDEARDKKVIREQASTIKALERSLTTALDMLKKDDEQIEDMQYAYYDGPGGPVVDMLPMAGGVPMGGPAMVGPNLAGPAMARGNLMGGPAILGGAAPNIRGAAQPSAVGSGPDKVRSGATEKVQVEEKANEEVVTQKKTISAEEAKTLDLSYTTKEFLVSHTRFCYALDNCDSCNTIPMHNYCVTGGSCNGKKVADGQFACQGWAKN